MFISTYLLQRVLHGLVIPQKKWLFIISQGLQLPFTDTLRLFAIICDAKATADVHDDVV